MKIFKGNPSTNFDFIAVFLKVALQIAKSAQHCVLHWCIFFPVFEIAQDYLPQARIHTGFHGFTEIGQIFHNKCIQFLVKNFKLSRLKSGKWFGQSVNILSE